MNVTKKKEVEKNCGKKRIKKNNQMCGKKKREVRLNRYFGGKAERKERTGNN